MRYFIHIRLKIKAAKIYLEQELRSNHILQFLIKICIGLLRHCINNQFLLLFMLVVSSFLIQVELLTLIILSFVLMLAGLIMLFLLLGIILIRILRRVIFCLKILGVLDGEIMDTLNLGFTTLIILKDHVIYCSMDGKLFHQNCDFNFIIIYFILSSLNEKCNYI